ncbi:MAG: XRE family transcriptional regulator [bacterium]
MTDHIASNVRRLRALKGMNQDEVAQKAGISRNAYRAIETGASEPRVGNLQRIADALDVSIIQLMQEVPKLETLRFRSRKTMTAQQRAERDTVVTEVGYWLKDFCELEDQLGKKPSASLCDLPGKATDPQQMAKMARDRLTKDVSCPIADICDVLEDAGIKLYLTPSKSIAFFGLSVNKADGGPAIAVNTRDDIPVERRIFSAAHELGHLLLHTDSYDGNVRDEEDSEPEEKQADAFAGYFLMPSDAFVLKWSEYKGLHLFDRVLKVKRYFQVSYKTVLRRLIAMGVAEPSIWAQFYKYYAMRFGKKLAGKQEPLSIEKDLGPEPYPLLDPDFYEDRLSGLVQEALEKNIISLDRAAEILDISLEDMRNRAESWSLTR